MVIVCGYVIVDPVHRDEYLETCRTVAECGRAAQGNLDFALSPDLTDPSRINILERWESQAAVEAFRNAPSEEQAGLIIRGAVAEYDVTAERNLF